MAPQESEARLVLRKDAGLKRPDPGSFGALDQPFEQRATDALSACRLRDVGADLGDAGVAAAARHRRTRDPADDLAVGLGDEPVLGEMGSVPVRPAGHFQLEGRVPGGDPLGVDAGDLGPVARPEVSQLDCGREDSLGYAANASSISACAVTESIVCRIRPVIRYGSAIEFGRRSSRYPRWPLLTKLCGIRTDAPRSATPYVNSWIAAVSWSPVRRSSFSGP